MVRPLVTDAPGQNGTAEEEHLRVENEQLRALCAELEQALHEGMQQGRGAAGPPELEALLEEKTETIRRLHQQIQELRGALQDAEAQAVKAMQAAQNNPHRDYTGPAPREEELLSLSEELERDRRQLQEDEQSLMQQMKDMELGMARERAELARQRNDLQRLQSEVRLEIERLERNGAVQSKIDNLKSRLVDATVRRGAAPGQGPKPAPATPPPAPDAPPPAPASAKSGLMRRIFRGNK